MGKRQGPLFVTRTERVEDSFQDLHRRSPPAILQLGDSRRIDARFVSDPLLGDSPSLSQLSKHAGSLTHCRGREHDSESSSCQSKCR